MHNPNCHDSTAFLEVLQSCCTKSTTDIKKEQGKRSLNGVTGNIPENLSLVNRYPVVVWECITYHGAGELVIVESSMDHVDTWLSDFRVCFFLNNIAILE